MKKSLISLLAIFLCSFAAMAQYQNGDPKTSEERAQEFVFHLGGKVLLTRHQKDSIVNVLTTYYDDMDRYQGNYHDKMRKALTTNRDAMVKRILVDESKYQIYVKLIGDHQRNRYENGGHGGQH